MDETSMVRLASQPCSSWNKYFFNDESTRGWGEHLGRSQRTGAASLSNRKSFGRKLEGNRFTPFETALDVQPDRVGNQSASFILGMTFRIAPLKRRTHRKVPAIFVTFDDDGELVRLHVSIVAGRPRSWRRRR